MKGTCWVSLHNRQKVAQHWLSANWRGKEPRAALSTACLISLWRSNAECQKLRVSGGWAHTERLEHDVSGWLHGNSRHQMQKLAYLSDFFFSHLLDCFPSRHWGSWMTFPTFKAERPLSAAAHMLIRFGSIPTDVHTQRWASLALDCQSSQADNQYYHLDFRKLHDSDFVFLMKLWIHYGLNAN